MSQNSQKNSDQVHMTEENNQNETGNRMETRQNKNNCPPRILGLLK